MRGSPVSAGILAAVLVLSNAWGHGVPDADLSDNATADASGIEPTNRSPPIPICPTIALPPTHFGYATLPPSGPDPYVHFPTARNWRDAQNACLLLGRNLAS